MKHVVHLIPTLDRIGGAEQQVILLATGLARRGWRLSILTLAGDGGDAAQKLDATGIAFRSLGMHKGLVDPRGWIRLIHWINQNQPDIVHAHLPHASLLARWSRVAAPMRVLIETIHSPAAGGVFRNRAYRISAALPDVVTAVSRAASDPWLCSGMLNSERLAIIPNGVEIDRWKRDDELRKAMRAQLSLTNEFLWLSVGRLDPVKDHSTLLRAFAQLSSDARLVIAGNGRLKGHLLSLVQDLGLSGRVQLPGFQTDVLPWLCAADGFVLSSRWEGLPIALLEAGACRLPAVITDIPGAREVLPEAQHYQCVPCGDATALATKMKVTMCLSDLERYDLGRGLYKSVCDRFSLDTVLHQWEGLYQLQLENNPQPSRLRSPASALGRTLQLQ